MATRVAACLIVKDGIAEGIERCIASARPYVSEVNVYDTGSTDGTLELLDRLASEPGAPLRVERGEWRDDFAWARTESYTMASPGCDWLLYLDSDDELIGGENVAAVVERSERTALDTTYVAYDYYHEHFWWVERIVRRESGHWEGVVGEVWRRNNGDNWRCGVGQPGASYAHPAALRVYHHNRQLEERQKYLAHIERAASDPERTPRSLIFLANLLLVVDDGRAIQALEAYLDGGWDRCEGTPNSYRVLAMQWLTEANARLGRTERAEHYRREWDACSQVALEPNDWEFWMSLMDDTMVEAWASMPPDQLRDVLLDRPPPLDKIQPAGASAAAVRDGVSVATRPRVRSERENIGRNHPCWCGSGRKFKRCCSGPVQAPAPVAAGRMGR